MRSLCLAVSQRGNLSPCEVGPWGRTVSSGPFDRHAALLLLKAVGAQIPDFLRRIAETLQNRLDELLPWNGVPDLTLDHDA